MVGDSAHSGYDYGQTFGASLHKQKYVVVLSISYSNDVVDLSSVCYKTYLCGSPKKKSTHFLGMQNGEIPMLLIL